MHDQRDTEVYEPIYQCEQGHIDERHKLVVIRLADRTIVKCPCGSEQLKCLEV